MRQSTQHRRTKETDITLSLNLDGSGRADIQTGVGMLDHLLTALACHGRMDLSLRAAGDLDVDTHHTAEDCGLVLGAALDQALGDRSGIARFGTAFAPLDEALARVVVDLSGRPTFHFGDAQAALPNLAGDDLLETLRALATAGRLTLHADLLRGQNRHHALEALFKALALALRQAVRRDGVGIPSTKGAL